jgi:hypothetical protein
MSFIRESISNPLREEIRFRGEIGPEISELIRYSAAAIVTNTALVHQSGQRSAFEAVFIIHLKEKLVKRFPFERLCACLLL